MRTLQPDNHQDRDETFCVPCVYYSKNLDSSFSPSPDLSCHACGLGFTAGDEMCTEMRTNNCGVRKKKD